MTKTELENHNWKEDDRIFVVKTKFKDTVCIPDTIEEAHYLDHPSYYNYICDEIFLTMEDAKNGFGEKSLRSRNVIKRKILAELKKIDNINAYINKLKELELEVETKALEYGAECKKEE